MANANFPFGLKPVRDAAGAPYNDSADLFYIPASDTNVYAIGDPVIYSGSADANGVPALTLAAAGGGARITGVIVGFRPTPAIVATGYRAASTEAYAYVEHDPNTLYEVQANAVMNPADVGLNADLVLGAPNTFFKRSTWQLNASTKATTATLQVRIRGMAQRADQDITATNANWLVTINTPTETGAAGSTGV